jgi:hypothetical protein
VETGLDLFAFPVILFHETGYSLHTLRQASRRSWRIGQRHPVEVKFFAYKDTMQKVCLRLMGKKLFVALAMEGKFAADGLQAIDGDDDMLTAMARELVENRGIGESADSVWRRLCPAPAVPCSENSAEPVSVPAEVSMPEPLLVIADQIPPVSPWDGTNAPRRISRRDTSADQLSLF